MGKNNYEWEGILFVLNFFLQTSDLIHYLEKTKKRKHKGFYNFSLLFDMYSTSLFKVNYKKDQNAHKS